MKVLKYDLTGSCSSPTRFDESNKAGDVRLSKVNSVASLQVSTVITSEGISYTAQKLPKYDWTVPDSGDWDMLTCFKLGDNDDAPEIMQTLRDEFDRTDDVFCASYLKTILLVTNARVLDNAVIQLFKSWGCLTVFQLPGTSEIVPGPYLFSSNGLFWAWRLFPDDREAFILSTIPSQHDQNTYETLAAAAPESSGLSIAVPSRLYFKKTEDFPLAGLRVSVKDIFHLKGVHTGAGNRAYRRLYPACTSSSAVVQKLIDLGAIIVGKAKTAEFAGSQEVIGDWCDYSYAFNARADGYLVSTGSSTGGASGVAAYPWLDFSIGSDAGGSVRDPAVVHGVYGFRPTHDGSPIKDAFLPCPIFQVPGYLGRSSAEMLSFGLSWLPLRPTSIDVEKVRLWFPSEYYADRKDVQSVAEEAVSKLAHWLGVEVNRQPLEEVWEISKPSSASSSFSAYFNKTFMDVLKHEYWEYTATFRNDYQHKFDAAPYVCKITQWIWSEGSATTQIRKEKALGEVRTHNEWLLSSIFGDINTLMIFPMYNLNYRDEYCAPTERNNYDGFDSNLHASLAGLPNVIVPVGQCKVHSPIFQKDVMFPVSLSIASFKDTDTALLRLIHKFLEATGMPTSVLTGANAFPIA